MKENNYNFLLVNAFIDGFLSGFGNLTNSSKKLEINLNYFINKKLINFLLENEISKEEYFLILKYKKQKLHKLFYIINY